MFGVSSKVTMLPIFEASEKVICFVKGLGLLARRGKQKSTDKSKKGDDDKANKTRLQRRKGSVRCILRQDLYPFKLC